MAIDQDGEIVASRGSCTALGLVIAAFALIADQAHKYYMLEIVGISPGERILVLPFMNFVYAINKGISYGWLQMESMNGQYALTAFAVVASIVLLVWLTRVTGRLLASGLGLIIGGALGNGIDRVRIGGVFDYIQLHANGYSWYIFNIADAAIFVGVVFLLYDSLILSRKTAANDT
ncbi:MAG: signal peptidase II [Pseudomonadota bacterium]